jgi:hypothetical protein
MVVDSRMRVTIYPSTTVAVSRGLFVLLTISITLLNTDKTKSKEIIFQRTATTIYQEIDKKRNSLAAVNC